MDKLLKKTGWTEFKRKIEERGNTIRLTDKIFWEISRCSDRHNDYMVMVMDEFDKLSNLDKIDVVQMLWGSLIVSRKQFVEATRKNGEKISNADSVHPEYFFGVKKKWQ